MKRFDWRDDVDFWLDAELSFLVPPSIKEATVTFKWDVKKKKGSNFYCLAEDYQGAGVAIVNAIFDSNGNVRLEDFAHYPAVFCLRHSLELLLKGVVLCNIKDRKVQNQALKSHDLSMIWHLCQERNIVAHSNRNGWLTKYLKSISEWDRNEAEYRYEFSVQFDEQIKGQSINLEDTFSKLIMAYNEIIRECEVDQLELTGLEEDFTLAPEFLVIDNKCWALGCPGHYPDNSRNSGNKLYDRAAKVKEFFNTKDVGYDEAIDILVRTEEIDLQKKLLPLLYLMYVDFEVLLKKFNISVLYFTQFEESSLLRGKWGYPSGLNEHSLQKLWAASSEFREQNERWNAIEPHDFRIEKAINSLDSLSEAGELLKYPISRGGGYDLNFNLEKQTDLTEIDFQAMVSFLYRGIYLLRLDIDKILAN